MRRSNHRSPLMPDNFELDCPPPTEDQLYPGATEEVDYLTYAEPALSMNDTEFLSCGNPIQAIYSIPFVENRSVDYYEAEQVSIQEALKADNLIFWWQYEHFMWGDLQVGCPVQYYRVLDYEPVTVIGVTTKRDRIPRRFCCLGWGHPSSRFVSLILWSGFSAPGNETQV